MTHISLWISPQLAHTLAWALLHFLWQGLALAAICSACMALCRTASARYVLALATLVLMLAAPAVTFFALKHSAVAAANTAPTASAAAILSAVSANLSSLSVSLPSSAAPNAPLRADVLLWFVEAWFAGVVFFSLRTAGGLFVIERMRRNGARPVSALWLEECLALQRRMGIARVVRYCECFFLEAPAVIGWFRPVVLLPLTALSGLSEEQLAAVIAHELAHIRRLDSFVNLFQIAAETLLFYHPAVWWLNKRIRAERENCCDDAALAIGGDAIEYARALTLMEEWRQRPALAMAANRSPLIARVARLLGIASPRSGIRSAGVAASILCLVGAIFAANGLMAAGHSLPPGITVSVSAVRAPSVAAQTAAAQQPQFLSAAAVALQTHSELAASARSVQAQSEAQHEGQGQGNGQGQGQAQAQGEGVGQGQSSSYVDQMKAQGYDNLTADELISLKVQGVTPEYIQQIKALGLHPTINELVSMRVQGIDPPYIKDMRDAGFNADINQLISLRIQGVTPEYVRDMRAAGIDGDASEFMSLRVQGITSDYVKEMKATGFNATPRELISLKVQGIDPQYIKDLRAAGLDGDVHQFVSLKVQGVTPEYIKDMKAAGINADVHQLIGMRVQGVTPDYVKALQSAGFQNLTANDYIRARVAGLTPEFIANVRSHGFKDLSLDKLIELKNADVF